MKNVDHIPDPSRLSEQSGDELGDLLRSAAEWEPPTGSQERIWRRMSSPHARLVDLTTEDDTLRDILASAANIEPPVGAQERIWRQMGEELAARQGLSEPKRLVDSDAYLAGLLTEASRFEPAPGKKSRVYRALQRPARPRWLVPVGAFAATAAVLLLVLNLRPDQPVPTTLAPATSLAMTLPGSSSLTVHRTPANAGDGFAVGDSLEVASSDSERFQVRGIGDVVLQERGASLRLQQANDHGVHLALNQGRISIHAEKRTRQAPLVIHALGAEVEVVGTIFSVETTAMGPRVFVKEGLVEVRSAGQVNRVGAGQTWPSTATMPGWATEAMDTLAGLQHAALVLPSLTVAADPPVVSKKEHTKVAKPSTSSFPGEGLKPTAANPASDLPSLLPVDPIEAPKPVMVMPVLPAAPRITPSATAVKSPLQKFEDDALDLSGRSLADLERRRVELARGSETRQMINVLFAIESSSDTAVSETARKAAQARARVELARVLEESGALRNAVDYRKKIAIFGSPEEKVSARFANLATFVALNEIEAGLKLAEICTHEGTPDQRAMAYVFKARLLANKGLPDAADSELAHASLIDVNAPDLAASYFDEWAKRTLTHAGTLQKIAKELRAMGSPP